MKKILKVGSCIMAALLLSGCNSSGLGVNSQDHGKELVVGVRTNLFRFSKYYEDSGQYLGFEDDFALELADRLGYSGVKFVGLKAEEREEALSSGKVDCLIATFSKTAERDEKFDLSVPYYKDYGRVIVENSTLYDDWSNLAGKKVGYLKGANSKDAFLNKLVEDGYVTDSEKAEYYCTMVTKNSYDDIISALEVGTLDAACMDGCIAQGLMDENMTFLSEKYYSQEEYCVATTKDSEITSKINEAINEMTSDGTMAELEAGWDLIYDTEGGEEE